MNALFLEPGFLSLTERIGRDPLLVQGAGGNTSLKDGDRLWVKSSGVRLSECRSNNAFTELDLHCVRARLATSDAEPDLSTCRRGVSGGRPSIETSLHALMPQRVVAHLHSVNALAWLIVRDS